MKTRISHVNGKYDLETSADLCEVFCVPTGESSRELFESGWLPAGNDEWYQCRSARVKLNPISGNRRRKLKMHYQNHTKFTISMMMFFLY